VTPFDLAFYPTFCAGCALGTWLAWKASGSVLFGWMPSGLGCLMVWLFAHAVRNLRRRRSETVTPQA